MEKRSGHGRPGEDGVHGAGKSSDGKANSKTSKGSRALPPLSSWLSPSGQRRSRLDLTAHKQGIKELLHIVTFSKAYDDLDKFNSRLLGTESDEESSGTESDYDVRLVPSKIVHKKVDDTEATEELDDSMSSAQDSFSGSMSVVSTRSLRRRESGPSSPYVIRKDKQGATTKWVASTHEKLCAPYLELNIQPNSKCSTNRQRRHRSSRTTRRPGTQVKTQSLPEVRIGDSN